MVPLPRGARLADTVVSNRDPILKYLDLYPDSEPSIAIDPAAPQHIVIAAFSSCWMVLCDHAGAAALWTSADGGATWAKSFSIPPPPSGLGVAWCPCDQTIEYNRSSTLVGTFLTLSLRAGFVYTGSTADPRNALAWRWQTVSGTAIHTNLEGTNADQPQLLENPDPFSQSRDDTYIAYDDFATHPVTPRVAVAYGTFPPLFAVDRSIGAGPACCVNPGLRLVGGDPSDAVYALWQQATFDAGASPKITVHYMLNRSSDGGRTWGLNGSPSGIEVASGASDQTFDSYTGARYKFGTVNALIGGIDSAAVDPSDGDLYYVYGFRDPNTSNNRLLIRRITPASRGRVAIGAPIFLTGQTQAALPSVAVTATGVVGVLYDTYDGKSQAGLPIFTAHLAEGRNDAAAFTDTPLLTFTSPMADNGDPRQRVLGDYQELKALGNRFYGTFTANGASFGRPFANTDAIFFMLSSG